jgi:hypothetical protein
MNSVAGTAPASTLLPQPKAAGRRAAFHLVPALDTYPRVLELAQTGLGKTLILICFAAGLMAASGHQLRAHAARSLALTALLAAAAFLPKYRRWVVTAGTLTWLAAATYWFDWTVPQDIAGKLSLSGAFNYRVLQGLVLVAVFVLATLWISLTRRYPKALPFRRPLWALTLVYAGALLAASLGLAGRTKIVAWSFLVNLGAYFWFLGYALVDARAKDGDGAGLQLGTFHPFWGSTTTPVPKGASYLRRIESRDAQQLAVSQLKALKLLAWACILKAAASLFVRIVHGRLLIPPFQTAFDRVAAGAPLPWYVCWLAVLATFVDDLLTLCVWGHTVIACCRLAGFRALRNTYRPLEAKTIAEFWNRYYFYFKELLVDLFFYPAFFRYFKGRKRLRIAAATFAAAGLGNMLFHFIRDIHYVAELGLWRAIAGFHVFAFYCLVLSAGIVASQLRGPRQRKSSHWFWNSLTPRCGVLLFYSLLIIFADTRRTCPLSVHFTFLLHMFGIRG